MIRAKLAKGLAIAAHPLKASYLIGLKLSQSIASSQLPNIPSRPFQATFFLLNRCNLNCPYCSFFGQADLWGKRDATSLQTEPLLHCIQQLPWKNADILLTGGEPLLHPEIDAILKAIGDSNHALTLFTNGTLLRQHKRAVAHYVDTLCLSLDGADAETHNFFRRGSYQNILDALSDLYIAPHRKPKLVLHFTLHPRNIAHLPLFPDLLKQLKQKKIPVAHVQFQHLFAAPSRWGKTQKAIYQRLFVYKLKRSTLPYYQNGSMDIALLRRNTRLLKKKMLVPYSFFPRLREEDIRSFYQEKTIPPSYRKPCLAAHTQLVVFPNGEVQICPDYALGNIHHDSLQTILRSEKMKKLRAILARGKHFPFCQTCCHLYKW